MAFCLTTLNLHGAYVNCLQGFQRGLKKLHMVMAIITLNQIHYLFAMSKAFLDMAFSSIGSISSFLILCVFEFLS